MVFRRRSRSDPHSPDIPNDAQSLRQQIASRNSWVKETLSQTTTKCFLKSHQRPSAKYYHETETQKNTCTRRESCTMRRNQTCEGPTTANHRQILSDRLYLFDEFPVIYMHYQKLLATSKDATTPSGTDARQRESPCLEYLRTGRNIATN